VSLKLWLKGLVKLRNAKGYDRTRLLKFYSLQAGKLIASGNLNREQARGMLLEACQKNKLAASGTSYVFKVIDKFILKGIRKTNVADHNAQTDCKRRRDS
jgi:hypothetical protein